MNEETYYYLAGWYGTTFTIDQLKDLDITYND